MINELSKKIIANNRIKGFYDSPKNIGEMLCLIHSEVSEALEADRKSHYSNNLKLSELIEDRNNYTWENSPNSYKCTFERDIKNTFEDELADIMIRVMDLAAFKGIDLEFHIEQKMKYNATRPIKHGKKY